MSLPCGHRFGPYEVVALIGRGGGGEVYRARDHRLGRDVAVKTVAHGVSRLHAERIEREARAIAALNHPNIIAVHDVGRAEGVPYIVTELLEGESLRAVLRGRRLDAAEAIAFARQIADALSAAHAKGIVHRDLKPENIFVLPDGRIKVLDFGIAKHTSTDGPSDDIDTVGALTKAGELVGTLAYLAPEQARGRAIDHRADIFGFGIVFYEMLTGESPFSAEATADQLSAILRDPPRPLPDSFAGMPALAGLIRHCLEKDPRARFQSAADLRFAMETLSTSARQPTTGSVAGTPADMAGHPRSPRRRFLVAAAVVTTVGVAAILAVVGPAEWTRRSHRLAASRHETIELSAPLVSDLQKWQKRMVGLFAAREVTLTKINPNHVDVTTSGEHLASAVSVLRMVDALRAVRFSEEPGVGGVGDSSAPLFTAGGQSNVRVSVSVERVAVKEFLQMIATSTGWPVVFDSSVVGDVTLLMSDVPWDLVVRSCLEFRGLDLAASRVGQVWLVTTRARAAALVSDWLDLWITRSRRVTPTALARALEPARTDRGVIVTNARLQAVVIVDQLDAFPDYARILATIDGTSVRSLDFPKRATYQGQPISFDFNGAGLESVLRVFQEISGGNIVLEPGLAGGEAGSTRYGAITMSLRDTPWDNALQVVLWSSSLMYTVQDKVLHVVPAAKRPSDTIVEAIPLQREAPEFFEAFSRYLTPRGAMSIERGTRTLVIRDAGSEAHRLKTWAEVIDGRSRD